MTFQCFFLYKYIETLIWPFRKKVNCQPRIIFWTILVDLESSMLYTKIQSQSFLGSGEEDAQVFVSYMGKVRSLICW